MTDTPRPSGYVQGEAETLTDVLAALEAQGYTSQFAAQPGGRLRCIECSDEFLTERAKVDTVRRLEGASDPDDMLAVLPVTCPSCNTRGTLVLAYGPEAALEDSEVLAALPEADHAPDAGTAGS